MILHTIPATDEDAVLGISKEDWQNLKPYRKKMYPTTQGQKTPIDLTAKGEPNKKGEFLVLSGKGGYRLIPNGHNSALKKDVYLCQEVLNNIEEQPTPLGSTSGWVNTEFYIE